MISLLKRWRRTVDEVSPAINGGDALPRARALFAAGRMREAEAAYRDAAALGSLEPELELEFAQSLLATNDPAAAEQVLRRALPSDGTDVPARLALVAMLQSQRRSEEAEALLEHAPGEGENVPLTLARATLRAAQGEFAGAEALCRLVIAKDATNSRAWNLLGGMLDRQRRVDEALEAFATAVRTARRDDIDADEWINHAITLRNTGRYADALARYERELPTHPHVHAYRAYATALLSIGRLEEAWPFYEFRWLAAPQLGQRPHFARPVWRGQSLEGKTILLYAEQGHGDVIQFARYARMVKALAGTVMLVVPRPTFELAKSISGVDRVLGPGDTAPDFDFWVPLLSLPLVFGTTLPTIPASVPYVAVDPERARDWAPRVAHTRGVLRVGLAWEGSRDNLENHLRSIPLATLAGLADVPGVAFFGLQKDASGELEIAASALRLIPLGADFRDFADTAAAIGELDLVISVCTSVAHLAGALGKPTWVLLHSAADWRWLADRDDTPWYPTARLFRQRQRGDWGEVVARVRSALEDVVAGRATLPSPPTVVEPLGVPNVARPRCAPGHKPGFAAVAETRYGILQYLPDRDETLGVYGEWRQGALDLLAGRVESGASILQVGAAVGAHALVLGEWCGGQGEVLAEEPDRVARRLLSQNVAANAARSVTVLRESIEASGGVDGMWLTRLDLLKVDDATRCAAVLAGADATLWRMRPMLHLQADAAELAALTETVRGYGYRCFAHVVPKVAAMNFNRREVAAEDAGELLALFALPEERELTVALPGCRELS